MSYNNDFSCLSSSNAVQSSFEPFLGVVLYHISAWSAVCFISLRLFTHQALRVRPQAWLSGHVATTARDFLTLLPGNRHNRNKHTVIVCVWPIVIVTSALRDTSPMTPPTKMTSLTTRVSHSLVVEHSNRQSGEVMGSSPVGDSENLFSEQALQDLSYIYLFICYHTSYVIKITFYIKFKTE